MASSSVDRISARVSSSTCGADALDGEHGALPGAHSGHDGVSAGSIASGSEHLKIIDCDEFEEMYRGAIVLHFDVSAKQANGQPLTLRAAIGCEDRSADIKAIYWITDDENGDEEYHNIELPHIKKREPYIYRVIKAKARSPEMDSDLMMEAHDAFPDDAWRFDPDFGYDAQKEHGTYWGKP